MQRKLWELIYNRRSFSWGFSLAIAACAGAVFFTHTLPFWKIARSAQALAVIGSMLLLTAPLYLLQKVFKYCWNSIKSIKQRFGLAAIALLAAAIFLLVIPRFAPLPTRHTITVEVPQVENPGSRLAVDILEVRDNEGLIIKPEKFSLSGNWQVAAHGFFTSGGQSARLTYAFYAVNGKNVQVLVQKAPGGGQALFQIDGAAEQVSFQSEGIDQQIYTFPLKGVNRWAGLVWVLDLLAAVGLVGVLVFIVSFYVCAWIPKIPRQIQKAALSYDKVFLGILFILLLAPLWKFSGSMQNLESGFTFRTPLLRGWSDFRFRFLGDRLFKKVIVGNGNWLLYTGEQSLDDYQNTLPVTEKDCALLQSRLDDINSQLEAKGITFLLVLAPNKNTIYPEYLPPQIPILGKRSFLDQCMEFQKLHGQAPILDLRPALLAARNEHQVYFATDSHWNPYGALAGYQEILRALQKDYPILQSHPLDDYQIRDIGMQSGDLALRLGQVSVTERFFNLVLKEKHNVKSWTMSSAAGLITVTSRSDQKLPKLVMYGDSFSGGLIPFLSDHFSRAVYLRSNTPEMDFIYSEKPDIVIVEVTERYLSLLIKSLNNETSAGNGGLGLDE